MSSISFADHHPRELSRACEAHIKQEDEGKFRCKTCQKLFKATSFVEKHIANKHSDLIKQLDEVYTVHLSRLRECLHCWVDSVLQQLRA